MARAVKRIRAAVSACVLDGASSCAQIAAARESTHLRPIFNATTLVQGGVLEDENTPCFAGHGKVLVGGAIFQGQEAGLATAIGFLEVKLDGEEGSCRDARWAQ